MKRRYVEVSCDHCGAACYYLPGNVDKLARADGWIITARGKHYDSRKCYKAAKQGK